MKHVLLTVFVALLAGWLAGTLAVRGNVATVSADPVYQRVMDSGVLRCGYGVFPPYIVKDLQSGKLSGLYHDYLTQMAELLSLKVEWVEEVGWAEFPSALAAGRMDAFCTIVGPTAGRARSALFTHNLYYQPFRLYARVGDTRFDNNLAAINQSNVRTVSTDGTVPQRIARLRFPQAVEVALPNLTPESERFVHVATNKADITIASSQVFALYDQHNPGKLREVPLAVPLQYTGMALALPKGAHDLAAMLDTAIDEMVWTGRAAAILKANVPTPGDTLMQTLPFNLKGVNP